MAILKLLFRNAFRHKLRTGLTVLGMAIAILSFGFLRTIIGAWYAGVEASSATRMVTRNAISLVFYLPLSYRDKLRQIDGVRHVSYGNWFGGIYIDEKNFFPNFAVEPATYLDLYPEYVVPDDQRKEFLRDRKGFVAGKKLVEKYRWQIGDQVTLKGTIFPGEWPFVLRAIYTGANRNVDETQFIFHWDYLNESLRKTSPLRADQVGFYMIGIANPGLSARIALAIDGTFRNSLAETITETEKAFQLSFVSMSEAIVVAIRLVSFVVIVIIMAVVANTMAMTARERMAEYAVFKTIGFGARHIVALVFGESLLITSLGCVLGVLLTFPAARVFSRELSTFFPIFNIETETIYFDIAASCLVGVIAAIFPAYRAVTIRIADGLRRVG